MFIILFFYVNMYINERYKYMSNKFDYYKKQIRLNKYFYSIFLGKKAMTMKYFEKAHGYSYDFKNPITFSEKLNSRKLEKNKLYSLCADKIKVKEYVERKIGKKYVIPTYFTSNKMTTDLYDKMPKSCVLKTANGSGTLIVIRDKTKEDKQKIINLMNEYLKVDFPYIWGEMFYKKVSKGILCEKLLLDENNEVPSDYKFHVFNNNGKTKIFVQVDFSRFKKHTRNIYDEKFNFIDMRLSDLDNNYDMKKMKKPKNYDEMIEVSKKLAEDFNYVRVDLYNVDGKIYFGELTFTHGAALEKFYPNKYDKQWGSY